MYMLYSELPLLIWLKGEVVVVKLPVCKEDGQIQSVLCFGSQSSGNAWSVDFITNWVIKQYQAVWETNGAQSKSWLIHP